MAGVSRRDFLQHVSGASAALTFMIANGITLDASPLGLPIGSQMWPHRARIGTDGYDGLAAVLKDLKGIGIESVEIKRGDQTHIGVVSREGGAVEMLVEDRGQNWPHSWAPDGDRIAFAGERGGVWNIWAVSRRTRTSRRLTQFTSASGYVRYPSWSPRGRRIVFERSQRTGSVWSVLLK